ncbi:PH domain-containing protein [Bacillus massilinigeriensis]|uniref:PH domain-containing protein n=1 Tax=Bacillus massilionigeriensis TaxID=1805475 RepID=UPI00096ADD2B|nr:PH domain-containing protein [Bacillus massilionigeriensis]
MLEPQKRISERALSVWRISSAIFSIFPLLMVVGVVILAVIYEWPLWLIAAAFVLFILYIYLFVYLFPKIRWRRIRYDVREQEIEFQTGIFVVKRTLIPMVRVQHVDTVQGPILRKYNLASVAVSTAATTHSIPALDMEEAEELRLFISRLARVVDEDV